MGLINFGIPFEITDWFINQLELDVFVEGGTYMGNTAKKMSTMFNKVYTIENSSTMYEYSKKNLSSIKNITQIKGDTRSHLKKLVKENDNLLFWLDSHWSGGDTYGEDDECPVLEELEIIFEHDKNYVILIDDARLFLSPPPIPHQIGNWPSYKEIIDSLPKNWESLVFDDVIYVFPEKISNQFKLEIQRLNTLKNTSTSAKNYAINFFKSLANKLKA